MQTLYSAMYGLVDNSDKIDQEEKKNPNRVIGGLKAQNSHINIFEDSDGNLVETPSVRYVTVLEQKLRQMSEKRNSDYRKIQKLEKYVNSLLREVKSLKDKL